jgi:hypothetical protein
VLVRPDGHVGWRSRSITRDPSRTMRDTVSVMLRSSNKRAALSESGYSSERVTLTTDAERSEFPNLQWLPLGLK